MRRIVLAIALLILALLALCGLVFGFLAWQGQAALTKQVEDLKTQVNGTNPPAGQTPNSTPPATPPTAPPSAACVGENKTIGVDAPTSKCCPGLIQVELTDSTSISQGLMFKCIRI